MTENSQTPAHREKPQEPLKLLIPDGTKDEVEVKVKCDRCSYRYRKYIQHKAALNKPYGQTATANEITAAVTTDAPQDKVQSIEVAGNITGKINL